MSDSIKDAYLVEKAPKHYLRYVPRRRSGDFSLPTTAAHMNTIAQEFDMADAMFAHAGLDDFVGCSNAEPSVRPVPDVFLAKETDAITALVAKHAAGILTWLFRQARPPWQSYNAVSRLGGPFLTPYDDKAFLLRKLLPAYLRSDFSIVDHSFVQIGGRTQEEPLSKIRPFTYINKFGEAYRAELDRRTDPVKVWSHTRYPARYRNVFNQPIFNLLNQVLDTALHDVYLRHVAFHHDIRTLHHRVKGPILALDVSRFERATARIVLERGRLIGGPYGAFQELMFNTPFLVVADDWRTVFLVRPNYAAGYMVQFGSGNSAVAPVQKDVFMALYSEFAINHLSVPASAAYDWVAGGGDDRLGIANYGDDNFLWAPGGDEGILRDLLAFLESMLAVSIEDPPAFLGAQWRPESRRFLLTTKSYVAKTYVNERGPFPPFRRYPFLGMLQKRQLYGADGDPALATSVFPFEDQLWSKNGITYAAIAKYAQDERLLLNRDSQEAREYFTSMEYLLGKQDYLISHEMKVKAGAIAGYSGLRPDETSAIIKGAVDPKWIALAPNFSQQGI